jgi:HK97 family phage major capsid protein
VNVQTYLARQVGTAIALGFGPHLISGTGSGQPRGVLADATVGVTGPTGTATSFGSQATAGQGTDLLNALIGSLPEPYTTKPSTAGLMRNATMTALRNLKTSAGELIGTNYLASSGRWLPDPHVPAMAANANSVIYGDWSRYFVRMVNGIRFEADGSIGFDRDVTQFRAILRLDAALVDTSALKTFKHSAT